jgi:hypothetical protein
MKLVAKVSLIDKCRINGYKGTSTSKCFIELFCADVTNSSIAAGTNVANSKTGQSIMVGPEVKPAKLMSKC